MLANLLVAIIVLGCMAYQYFKGTIVKSFAILMAAIFASITAFNYFEILAKSFGVIGFIVNFLGKEDSIGWQQTAAFLLLFILDFIILLTIAERLTRQKVDLGLWPERVGRVLLGGLGGIVISGVLITALMMAPLASGKPYQRFDPQRVDLAKASKVLLNADGVATGLFSKASSVSFSGETNFAVAHADFLDQVALTNLYLEKDKSSLSLFNEISLPKKIAAWPAPANLEYKESEDEQVKTFEPTSGKKLLIVKVGIRPLLKKSTNIITMSQVRLICKQQASGEKRFSGKGENVYPIGVMSEDVLLKTSLSYTMSLEEKQFAHKIKRDNYSGNIAWIDFAFDVPNDMVPVAVGLKRSSIAEISSGAIAKESLTSSQIDELEKDEN